MGISSLKAAGKKLLNTLKNSRFKEYINNLILTLNIISILSGGVYIRQTQYGPVWNFLGIILLFTLGGNALLAYFNAVRGEVKSKRILGYTYLIFSMLSMLGMGEGVFLISNSYESGFMDVPKLYLAVYIGYFGSLVLGCLNAYPFKAGMGTAGIGRGSEFRPEGVIRRAVSLLLSLLLFGFMITGVFFCYVILSRVYINNTELLVPGFSVFCAYIFLSSGLLLLIYLQGRGRLLTAGIKAINCLTFFVCMLPLLLSPFSIKSSGKAFAEAFGESSITSINKNTVKYFLKTPLTLHSYFLGMPSDGNIRIRKNVLFYKDERGIDNGIRLYFDAYLPPEGAVGLPGKNSTLIRIHGGAWVTGDKGLQNMLQENKYFAQQGYVVFDIQYGLSKDGKFTMDFGEPDYVKGSFTIDDMMRHVGIFTNYLYNHRGEYGANLDSVFISGGSAGGHLACAAALAISSGRYNDIFNSHIKVKGVIPFYPANGLANRGDIDGRDEFMNPEKLVESSSPPALIFQGTHDGLVAPKVSEEFKKAYAKKDNNKCAILWAPLAGHSSNINFSGNYNQIFLYYMERFMYLYR